MKNKTHKSAGLIATIAMIAVCLTGPFSVASANSAQSSWSGTTASGVVVKGEGQCPLKVTSEELVFSVEELPSTHWSSEGFREYGARVTASYTFFNPAEYDVTVTALFPFGRLPDYLPYDMEDGEIEAEECEKYLVTIGSEEVQKRVRHSYYDGGFNVEKDLARLSDKPIKLGELDGESSVFTYVYRAPVFDDSEYKSAVAAFAVAEGELGDNCFIYFPNMHGATREGSSIKCFDWISSDDKIVIYSIGKDVGELEFTCFKNGALLEELDIEMQLEQKTQATLYQFAMENYDGQSGISEIDWYNAIIANIKANMNDKWMNGVIGRLSLTGFYSAPGARNGLMRWYEYQMTVKAGESVVNSVIAPLYPEIRADYTPTLYTYEYLLTPASTWASFENLTVKIKTPLYLISSNIDGFEKTEDGYLACFERLPTADLKFSMATEQTVVRRRAGGWSYSDRFSLTVYSVALAVLAVIALSVVFFIKLNKKARDQ